MIYSHEVEMMCPVAQGANHGPAPIPEEAKWVKAKEVKDISGLTHGVGWCAPQQGTCKLTLNVKDGIIQEALVETIGCSGMTHSAAMASEILPGKTILEALNTDLVCDAINTAMRELFLQIVYGRTQSAFSEDGLPIGAGLEDLGKGLRSQVGTMYGTLAKGPRYLEMAEGYVTGIALDENNEIIGYQFVSLGKFTEFIKAGDTPNDAWEKAKGQYGRVADAVKAVENKDGEGFLRLLEESGNSSWEWLQNCYSLQNCKEQKITLSLALTKLFLNKIGAGICRVHGGGFAGVIMCVLPIENAEEYVEYMALYVGRENVYPMNIRSTGAVHVE